MFGIFPLVPAYGRDYKSIKEVMEAFNGYKDFQMSCGSYCSKRDFPAGQKIEIRYAKLRKVVCFDNKEQASA